MIVVLERVRGTGGNFGAIGVLKLLYLTTFFFSLVARVFFLFPTSCHGEHLFWTFLFLLYDV